MNAQPQHGPLPQTTPEQIRHALRSGTETALLDLREEGAFATGHPLFAVNLPLGRIEERIADLIPRKTTPIVLYDNGENRVAAALSTLQRLGYTQVTLLSGGLEGWIASGGEIFIDVNVPSKAFGELVEHVRHTPSLPAQEVHARLERGDDLVILDARRFVEYTVMSIPQGRSVPGAELALRVQDIAPSPSTTVIVNCAGRTRSIIGTQSLINANIPNPVYALRNGTIGWTLAGFDLEHGATRTPPESSATHHALARERAQHLAERAGVRTVTTQQLTTLINRDEHTTYLLDVRSPEEYAADHLSDFRSAPGGQLVQATDEWVGVRHATLILTDTDGVRARMTAHWLRQLGWQETYVLDDWTGLDHATGFPPPRLAAPLPETATLSPADLAVALASDSPPLLLDLDISPNFKKNHIDGSFFIIPTDIFSSPQVHKAEQIVLTSSDGVAAHSAAVRLSTTHPGTIHVLAGGTAAWQAAGYPLVSGFSNTNALSEPVDVYKRPYEGTDNAGAAMQAYLDWEFGLVAQLERDGTHGFQVLE
ncbi:MULTISPECIES: rhodanese-like domain-containing protein [Acetobacter]|jgi:rhodanese-related sulfurtransferase|uniref:rhodanese-like domain-containing protein n=1 Tax=Acetobacter TaxID=434 RepID=UPI00376F5DD3